MVSCAERSIEAIDCTASGAKSIASIFANYRSQVTNVAYGLG
jgi:hypothetical protein